MYVYLYINTEIYECTWHKYKKSRNILRVIFTNQKQYLYYDVCINTI